MSTDKDGCKYSEKKTKEEENFQSGQNHSDVRRMSNQIPSLLTSHGRRIKT